MKFLIRFLFLAVLLASAPASAVIDVYVDTDVSGGDADGTSWANAYSSLNVAQVAEQTNLVTATDYMIIHCQASSGTADTTVMTLDYPSWITSDAYYLQIQCDDISSPGVWDSTAYRIDTTTNDQIIESQLMHVRLIGLQLRTNQDKATVVIRGTAAADGDRGEIYIEDCILISTSATNAYDYGISIDDTYLDTYISNTVVYGFSGTNTGGGIKLADGTDYSNIWAYNNTVIDCYNGYTDDGATGAEMYIKNNVSFGCTDAYNGTFGAGSVNNAYDEGSDPGSSGVDISSDDGTALFKDYNSDDFHVKDTDSSLYQAGADLDADANLAVTDDIDGDSRHATTPCIGADEYDAGTPATPANFQIIFF